MKFGAIFLALLLVAALTTAINAPDVAITSTGSGIDIETDDTNVKVGKNAVAVGDSVDAVVVTGTDDSVVVLTDDVDLQVSGNRAVVANAGEDDTLRVMVQNRAVEIVSGEGVVTLKGENVQARSSLDVRTENKGTETSLKVRLSNGNDVEVKIMPDTASERAIERLSLKVCSAENGCTIELKETGTGDEAKLTYEVKAKKESRVLGLFKKEMNVEVQVDAESGEVVKTHKPWWAFLAAE